MLEQYLNLAISHHANDLHLTEGLPPVVRVGGNLLRMKTPPLTAEKIDQIMRAVTPPRCMVEFSKGGCTDFSYNFKENRFRVSLFRHCGAIGLAMRQFHNTIFSLDQLHLSREIRTALVQDRGLFLVTGATGSGKTSTMASLVDFINEHHSRHIVTIEDPVEILHTHKKSIVSQREIGTDVLSFVEGVRRCLRHDPDVILVGEIRDPETSRITLRAAETGHLVFGTLHARTASSAVTRIIAEFPYEEQEFIRMQLANSLLGVINQVLVPTGDETGLTAVMEIMMNTQTVASLIRQNKESLIADEIRKGRAQGMISFDESLERLCVSKVVDYKTALRYAREPDRFKGRMEKK